MENLDSLKYVPPQQEGAQSNTTAEKTLDTEVLAKQFFDKTATRLMNINNWSSYTGALTADFQLCDSKGNEVQRPVQMHDYFKINVPGPGTVTGDGYDWVQVEALEKYTAPHEDMVLITVRPTNNPLSDKKDIAHFFTDESTSSFIVKRTGIKVTAEVHGRNEKPNTKADSIIDKARNVFAGSVAVSLFSKYQWKSLVEGLLDFEL
jgi:hypothetical protein